MMPCDETDLLLRALPIGKHNAIGAHELRRRIGTKRGRTEERVRKLVRQLLAEGIAVASCSRGYFICATSAEVAEYIDSLLGRIAGIESRIADMKEAWGA